MNESDTAPPRGGRFARAASGAALAVVLLVGGAAPAGAEPTRSLSIDPTGDVTTSPTASGNFAGASALGVAVEKITAVELKVSPSGPTGGEPVTQNGCEVATSGSCNGGQITYSWEIPPLDYNGPYVVEAFGTACDLLLCLSPGTFSAPSVEFRLGADPKAPTDLKAEPGDERKVALSWARNGEPDLQYYALFRKDPGGDFRRLGNDIKQPASGRPSFTDTSAAGTNGGDFVYKVFAVRNGSSGDTTTNRISKASTERTATVAPPPTTTNPGGGPDGGGPVTTVAGEGVDIGSFLSGQAPTLPTPGPIFLDLPDTGFGELLPFGSLPDEAEPGEEDAVLPTTPRQRQVAEFKANRPLIPVAAGLLLLVLSAHIRLLNVRTKAAPEKPPPGAYVARALEEARSVRLLPLEPAPLDIDAAVANGGHHRAPPPPSDDLAALPVWAEFEPVSALGLLDDSGDDYEQYAPPRSVALTLPPEAVFMPVPEIQPETVVVPEPVREPVLEAKAKAKAKGKARAKAKAKAPAVVAREAEPVVEPVVVEPVVVEPEPTPGDDSVFGRDPQPEPEPEPEPEPRVKPESELVYASGAGSDWAEPEVFVGPRR